MKSTKKRVKSEIINTVKIEFISRSNNESFARTAVSAFAAQLDPTVEELSDLKTAISEAVTNSIVHGYREDLGKITITGKIYDNRRIELTVKDKGCGIDDVKKAMEPMYTTDSSGERSGVGFMIMEMLCDKIAVKSSVGKGTTVVLHKKINSRKEKSKGDNKLE